MKNFESFLIDESSLRQRLSSLLEKVDISKSDFINAMGDLYDAGDEEAITRASQIVFSLQIEKEVAETFEEKCPTAAKGAREKLALEIQKLKISGPDKVKLAKGIRNGEAYDIEKLFASDGVSDLSSIVNSSYVGAKELLKWFVDWNESPNSGRGKASTEIFFILAGKNGRPPSKGDAIVNGVKIELKSNAGSYDYEFTVTGGSGRGGQANGEAPRDEWIDQARSLYRKYKIMEKWYPGTPFGFASPGTFKGSSEDKALIAKYNKLFKKGDKVGSRKVMDTLNRNIKNSKDKQNLGDIQPGKDARHLSATMTAFCAELQLAGMAPVAINSWIVKTTHKVLKSSGHSTNCWNGKKFDAKKFLCFWASCALDYYRKTDGWDKLCIIHRGKGKCLTLSSGKSMSKLESSHIPSSISNKGMPGQNGSVAKGNFKL